MLKVKIALIEITAELFTSDHEHGLYTLLLNNFADGGYVLAGSELVRDSELGGNQSRRRLILTFEREDVNVLLPPLPSIFEYSQAPSSIMPSLEPVKDLPPLLLAHRYLHPLQTSIPTVMQAVSHPGWHTQMGWSLLRSQGGVHRHFLRAWHSRVASCAGAKAEGEGV
jgi:hypothetical protein